VAQLIWFGVDDNSFVLVLELCGSNVRSLLDYCGGRLSMKTVLNLTDKLLIILESLHKQGALLFH
jgi:serine/threonine protein kinase